MPNFLPAALKFLINNKYLTLKPYEPSVIIKPKYFQFERNKSYPANPVSSQANTQNKTQITLFNGWTKYASQGITDQERALKKVNRLLQLDELIAYLDSSVPGSHNPQKDIDQEIYVPILFQGYSTATNLYETSTSYSILQIKILDNSIQLNVYDPSHDKGKFNNFIKDLDILFTNKEFTIKNIKVGYLGLDSDDNYIAQRAEIYMALMMAGNDSFLQNQEKSLKDYEAWELFPVNQKNDCPNVLGDGKKTNKTFTNEKKSILVSKSNQSNQSNESEEDKRRWKQCSLELNVLPILNEILFGEKNNGKDGTSKSGLKKSKDNQMRKNSIFSIETHSQPREEINPILLPSNPSIISATMFKRTDRNTIGIKKIPDNETSPFSPHINILIDEANSWLYRNKVRKVLKILILSKFHLDCKEEDKAYDFDAALKAVKNDVENENVKDLSSEYIEKLKTFFAKNQVENKEDPFAELKKEILKGNRTKKVLQDNEIIEQKNTINAALNI